MIVISICSLEKHLCAKAILSRQDASESLDLVMQLLHTHTLALTQWKMIILGSDSYILIDDYKR